MDYPNNGQNQCDLYYDADGAVYSDICFAITTSQPLEQDESITIKHGDNNEYYFYSDSVQDGLYYIKLKKVRIDIDGDEFTICTSSNQDSEVTVSLDATLHEYVDYSSISSGNVVDSDLLLKLIKQINTSVQNYFYYLNTYYGADHDIVSENLENVEFIRPNYGINHIGYENALRGWILLFYEEIINCSRAYYVSSGIYELPIRKNDLLRFVWDSDETAGYSDGALFLHEQDDAERVSGNRYKLTDRFIADVVSHSGKWEITYNPDLSQGKALLITEEGKWNVIVADENVLADDDKTLNILHNYQRVFVYLVSNVFSY